MMLRYSLEEPEAAEAIEAAVAKALDHARTADIVSPELPQVSCKEMGQLVRKFI
jgi:3-isopropylmalate dehydrogenase